MLAVLDGLPEGADTQLGTEWAGGVELSVGQWQRIAIARGYFRDAPFLILDEPTAALDPRAEAAVFDSIRDLYEGRTVLLISHRFSSVRSADRIYVMSNGAIIEHGTHSELMDAAGTYHDLFTLQATALSRRGRRVTARAVVVSSRRLLVDAVGALIDERLDVDRVAATSADDLRAAVEPIGQSS